MKSLTFNAFTKKIHIKAPLEKLYWCWATEAGITSWFLRTADYEANGQKRAASDFIQAGDAYTWTWHNWDIEEKGSILEANGKDRIVFSFAGDCRVTVTLEDKGSAVLVSLIQSGIPTDEDNKLKIHHGCSNGWTFWMVNLKAWLEHGISLNETEFDLAGDELAGYEYVNL